MTFENFAYWLQGYAEICGNTPSDVQWEIIREHLQLCFNKVTTNIDQNRLNTILSKTVSGSYRFGPNPCDTEVINLPHCTENERFPYHQYYQCKTFPYIPHAASC